MKKFFTTVFASTLGFCLAIGVFILIAIVFISASLASVSSQPALKENSVLHISLNGTITERNEENPINDLLGEEGNSLSINQALDAIKKAEHMDEIKGIFLDGGALVADPASLQEIRKALVSFKKSGKFIFSYADTYTQGAYYLSSVANKIALNPSGSLDWHGLSSEPVFYKDFLAKFGIKMQVFKVGTFKSAVEPFTNTQMSDANRQQVTSYMGSIWNNFVKDISASRNIPADSLQHYADKFMALQSSKELAKTHMIDTFVYIDGAKDMLKKLAKVKEKENISFISPSELCQIKDPKAKKSDNKVAVYYAEGSIVENSASGFSPTAQIIGSKVVKDMQKLEDDEDIKAVVIRINSGGGSAYASEQMWHAIKKLNQKKPVIVSMGGMAASGGYYMSSASQYIFAEPTTITGSIGIFGMFPDASTLMTEKLGMKYDNVKTNKLADFGASGRPFNAAEGELLQKYIEEGYALFLQRVAEGRKKSTAQVDAIGQGRVWTGEQALKLGLVDKLGTLDEAIAYAAKKSGLGEDYESKTYPETEPWYIEFLNKKKSNYYESKLKETLGEYYKPFMLLNSIKKESPIQARIPFEPNIR